MISTGIFFSVHDEAAEVLADPLYGMGKKGYGILRIITFPGFSDYKRRW